ncbi:adenylate kinase [Nocardia jiangxiensis]|uniref:Adenylate kinase n=1 Tax=Nocardia jiangxiensis TaxID=282685 RepID=A0ABW6S9Z3_9NOCA|nr:adenylate kinase [Nocardia jiangxiensis]
MQRVVVLGRGGAGKSVLARRLAEVTGLPVTELDELFWSADATPIPRERWAALQRELVAAPTWILDGDLGPFDVLEPRLRAADTIVVLDFPLGICIRRALRRSRESLVFWRWMVCYRRRSLPDILTAVTRYAPNANLQLLRHPREVERFLHDRR